MIDPLRTYDFTLSSEEPALGNFVLFGNEFTISLVCLLACFEPMWDVAFIEFTHNWLQ